MIRYTYERELVDAVEAKLAELDARALPGEGRDFEAEAREVLDVVAAELVKPGAHIGARQVPE